MYQIIFVLNLTLSFLKRQHFSIISPCKRAWSFIWRDLNPLYPRMLCANFGWNWLSGSGEEKYEMFTVTTTPTTTDKFLSDKLTWALVSGELIKNTEYVIDQYLLQENLLHWSMQKLYLITHLSLTFKSVTWFHCR